MCALAWRIRQPGEFRWSKPSARRHHDPSHIFHSDSWNTFFEACAEAGAGSRQSWPADLDLDSSEVDELVKALFGTAIDALPQTQRRTITMRLLLAAIGVEVELPKLDGTLVDRKNAHFGLFDWTLSSNDSFFDAKMRIVCGVEQKGDKEEKAWDSDLEFSDGDEDEDRFGWDDDDDERDEDDEDEY